MKTEQPVSAKQINLERIRIYMEKTDSASKSQMARELGLSFPTAGRLVDELCALGELQEQGAGVSTGGRCACFYRLNPLYNLYLLIQIEAERICWNLKDSREGLVEQGQAPFTTLPLEKLDALILDMVRRFPHLRAITIGIAALINRGVVEETSQFANLLGINLEAHVAQLTTVPAAVENDMNFLTMGCWSRKRPAHGSLVAFFLGGNGMGGGMVIDGKLWTGASGYCSEVSFLPLYSQYMPDASQYTPDASQYAPDAKGGPEHGDFCELYARLIQTYAVTVNPHMVVLYRHPVLDGKIDRIRCRCGQLIPAKAIPSIELSSCYQEDYEKGLFAVARSL